MALSGLFAGNEREQKGQQMREEKGVCPAGQSLTLKWPVLRHGSVPQFDRAHWDLQGFGQVRNSLKFSSEEFNRLPRITTSSDFHCVTRWSRFDNHGQGIAFRREHKTGRAAAGSEIRSRARRAGYTANIPLDDLDRDDVLPATHHDGKPLDPEHRYPLGLIVPQFYGWKSVKWVRGFEFLDSDAPGFWEQNGCHMRGDPGREQRFDPD